MKKKSIELNQRQINFIAEYCNLDYPPEDMTIQSVCRRAGIHRDTFYSWRKDPDFMKEMNKKLGEIYSLHGNMARGVIVDRMAKGDLHAVKLYLEHGEKWIPKSEVATEMTTKIEFRMPKNGKEDAREQSED